MILHRFNAKRDLQAEISDFPGRRIPLSPFSRPCTQMSRLQLISIRYTVSSSNLQFPVFSADPLKICRGTWFKGASSEDQWVPIDEEDAGLIETSHQAVWSSMVLKNVI